MISKKTQDNSITFYNQQVGDYYHSQSGAREEAFEKHAKALNITDVKNPVIFDICFGLGYNSAAALDLTQARIFCFENDKEILKKILEIDADFESYPLIKEFIGNFLEKGKKEHKNLTMIFGDAKQEIQKLNQKADFVFFDPFSPAKVPYMWTVEFFKDIKAKMKPGAKLSTYSCAKFVRENLKRAGFIVEDGPVIGRKSPATIAKVSPVS